MRLRRLVLVTHVERLSHKLIARLVDSATPIVLVQVARRSLVLLLLVLLIAHVHEHARVQ